MRLQIREEEEEQVWEKKMKNLVWDWLSLGTSEGTAKARLKPGKKIKDRDIRSSLTLCGTIQGKKEDG